MLQISLPAPFLELGDCFLGHLYEKRVQLSNESDFYGQYNTVEQEASAKAVYSYEALNPHGNY